MAESRPTEVGASRAAPAASRPRGRPSRCASRRAAHASRPPSSCAPSRRSAPASPASRSDLAVHLHLRQGRLRLRRERLQQVRRPRRSRTTAAAPCHPPPPRRRDGPRSPAPGAVAPSAGRTDPASRNSRENVSWLGIPFSSVMKSRSHGSRTHPKSSMSTHMRPPISIDSSAIASVSCRSWRLALPRRAGPQHLEKPTESPASRLSFLGSKR